MVASAVGRWSLRATLAVALAPQVKSVHSLRRLFAFFLWIPSQLQFQYVKWIRTVPANIVGCSLETGKYPDLKDLEVDVRKIVLRANKDDQFHMKLLRCSSQLADILFR
jgi:hypothetical protein